MPNICLRWFYALDEFDGVRILVRARSADKYRSVDLNSRAFAHATNSSLNFAAFSASFFSFENANFAHAVGLISQFLLYNFLNQCPNPVFLKTIKKCVRFFYACSIS